MSSGTSWMNWFRTNLKNPRNELLSCGMDSSPERQQTGRERASELELDQNNPILGLSLLFLGSPNRKGRPQRSACANIRLFFSYNACMWQLPETRVCNYTVTCKGCGENIPAPVQTMPDTWIIATCPLCGERRSYLPPDIFRGRLSQRLLTRKLVKSEPRFR